VEGSPATIRGATLLEAALNSPATGSITVGALPDIASLMKTIGHGVSVSEEGEWYSSVADDDRTIAVLKSLMLRGASDLEAIGCLFRAGHSRQAAALCRSP
jgi:hypothetical protein